MAAKLRIPATMNLVWVFMCSWLTIKMGRIPKAQSAMELSVEAT